MSDYLRRSPIQGLKACEAQITTALHSAQRSLADFQLLLGALESGFDDATVALEGIKGSGHDEARKGKCGQTPGHVPDC